MDAPCSTEPTSVGISESIVLNVRRDVSSSKVLDVDALK
jgi:hypothetical protein